MIAHQLKFDTKNEIAIDKIAGVGCRQLVLKWHIAARHEVIE